MKAVWTDILDEIKDSIEDPASRDAMKKIIDKALIKHQKKHPGGAKTASSDGDDPKKFGSSTPVAKGTVISSYNLHWNDWKAKNTEKTYQDEDGKNMSAHKYWQQNIWPNLPAGEKKKYDTKANELRAEVKKESKTKEKRKPNKSAYQLFLERMKNIISNDEEFSHPESGETVKTHHFLIYVWSSHIKNNKELLEPFETMAAKIRENDDDEYDLSDLPYLDVDKLRANDFDDLELITD